MTEHKTPTGWQINTHELTRRAGEMISKHEQLPAPAGVGLEVIRVPEGAPVDVDVRLESVVEGVLVTGSVAVPVEAECSRCLTDISYTDEVEIQELYFYPGKDADDDALFIEDDVIDLEPAVRDAVVLDLPFSPLCRDDCQGLCPQCGINLNEEPDHAHEAAIDPRWQALADFTPEE